MTSLTRPCSLKFLRVLPLLITTSACSGGSTPVDTSANVVGTGPVNGTATDQYPESIGTEQSASAMNGTIIIEERNGKTVFDAFFSHSAFSTINTGLTDDIISADTCSVSAVQFDVNSASPVELGAASAESEYAGVGNAVTIDSRVGQFEALIKQQAGDLAVYAPNSRWQSVPLPEDATISFEKASVFEQLGTVPVPALLPLVWLAPEAGAMSNPAESLRWEASFNEQTKIKMRLSAIDFSDSNSPEVVTVSCDLVDDGQFTVPVVFQHQLPDSNMGIAVYAVRERIRQVQIDSASLTIVQLSYPAPIEP